MDSNLGKKFREIFANIPNHYKREEHGNFVYVICDTLGGPNHNYSLEDKQGNVIIPHNKYSFIDVFDRGIARVRNLNFDENNDNNYFSYGYWGLIDERGNEVLPCEYFEIWNFVGKSYPTTRVKTKNGVYRNFNIARRCFEN